MRGCRRATDSSAATTGHTSSACTPRATTSRASLSRHIRLRGAEPRRRPCLRGRVAATLAPVTAHSLSRREFLGGGLAVAPAALLPAPPAPPAGGDPAVASAVDAPHANRPA